jgi:hypothetical protein
MMRVQVPGAVFGALALTTRLSDHPHSQPWFGRNWSAF